MRSPISVIRVIRGYFKNGLMLSEVDDGMTDVEHIHPKNAADDCTALLRYEIWQSSCAEFLRKFTAALPRRVFGNRDRSAEGPRADQALKMPA